MPLLQRVTGEVQLGQTGRMSPRPVDNLTAIQENDHMSTILELPDDLMREVERQASRAGSNPDEFLATFLRNRFVAPAATAPGSVVPKRLPYIKARLSTPDPGILSQQGWCDWVKEQELQLEAERYAKALGHQFVDRAHG